MKLADQPVNDLINLQFSLRVAITAGTQVGAAVILNNVSLTDGLFTVRDIWSRHEDLMKLRSGGTTRKTSPDCCCLEM